MSDSLPGENRGKNSVVIREEDRRAVVYEEALRFDEAM